ncbi:hypothetical protein BDN70DRAFT_925021, partial [Pholiota conissans]
MRWWVSCPTSFRGGFTVLLPFHGQPGLPKSDCYQVIPTSYCALSFWSLPGHHSLPRMALSFPVLACYSRSCNCGSLPPVPIGYWGLEQPAPSTAPSAPPFSAPAPARAPRTVRTPKGTVEPTRCSACVPKPPGEWWKVAPAPSSSADDDNVAEHHLDDDMEEVQFAGAASVSDSHNYKQAMKGDDSDRWRDAANAEYNTLLQNQTWEIPGRALERQDSDSGQHRGSAGPIMVPVNWLPGDGNDAGGSTLPVSGPWQMEKAGITLLCKAVCAAPNREVTMLAAKPADADRD